MSLTGTPPPGWRQFMFGDLPCAVASDGEIHLGPARDSFPNAEPEVIDRLLEDHYLPTDHVVLQQNVLLVETGEGLVMFDTGVGVDPELGRKEFGPQTGQLLGNLAGLGISAADIDLICLTHPHPDHAWGLADEHGAPRFPRARVVLSRSDHEYWTDLSRVAAAPTEHAKDQIRGAHKNLLAYADRLVLLDGDTDVLPGIRAISTPGHSPGHMVYEVSSAGERMLVWGDLCHHHVLLLTHPEWNFMFDYHGPSATEQRRRIYDYVSESRLTVLGYHFPFPGVGHLRRDANGYTWQPVPLSFAPPQGCGTE